MGKNLVLKDCDAEMAKVLRDEIVKVRCRLTGYGAGCRNHIGLYVGVPGEDALRQLQIIIDNSIRDQSAKK